MFVSLPRTILITTCRLIRYGALLIFIGTGVLGHLRYHIVVCIAFFIVLDCWVSNWLRASHDSSAVTIMARKVCTACQIASFISQISCMQFYHQVPMVRAVFLMVVPSFLAGCSRDAKEASVLLLLSFAITASCESEPAFLLCEVVQSSWMIFGAWKGQKLIQQTQQEATLFFVQSSERMMQQALKVLLDCTVVMEQATAQSAPQTAEPGAPVSETACVPVPNEWRVLEGNPAADHFFGLPVAGVNLGDRIRSLADQSRFDEALRGAAQSGEHARMVSNVNLRCSALAGAAASLLQRGPSAGDLGADQHFVDCNADLVVIGWPDLPQPAGLRRRRTVFVGVRVAEKEPPQSAAPSQRQHRHQRRSAPLGGGVAAPAPGRPPAKHGAPAACAAELQEFSTAALRHRALPSDHCGEAGRQAWLRAAQHELSRRGGKEEKQIRGEGYEAESSWRTPRCPRRGMSRPSGGPAGILKTSPWIFESDPSGRAARGGL
ncbi:unnamed protein product [Prorocentrum cordatum]|uniref:PAS domain-containing protein n=1 Tax=Prorocentrum cordatum TaxID=2364126 RepID=A0ABN9QEU5_9DINO|nr:unnamed protein product [Polarella glacialis]